MTTTETTTTTAPEPINHLPDVPTVAEYKDAFLACRPALRSKHGYSILMEMLKANYHAPDRTVTPGDLARTFEMKTFKAANLAYGKFAKAMCEKLHRTPKFNLAVLVNFAEAKPDGEAVRLTMRPEVASALEELGWVKPADVDAD